MCGRVTVKASPTELIRAFAWAAPGDIDRMDNLLPRFNGAPSQSYPILVHDSDLSGAAFMDARWGFVPRWSKEPGGGRKPINARSETVVESRLFGAAYRRRRALMPITSFFEWQAIRGAKTKQPWAIAMKDLAAIWEESVDPATGDRRRTFAVLTCEANELMARIHDRMPVIVAERDYRRWLSEDETDHRDLLRPYPAELMTMWRVSRAVGSPRNDTPDILDPVEGDE